MMEINQDDPEEPLDVNRFVAEFAGLARICRSAACRRADACIGPGPRCFHDHFRQLRTYIFPLLRNLARKSAGLPLDPADANAGALACQWFRRLGYL